MESRSDFYHTPHLSLTSLICAPLFERSVKIERALSTKMRDASDVGLKILLVKFSCDLCNGLAPDAKISLILFQSKLTSRSCKFSLSSRRSRVPINNFMSSLISSMSAIGQSANPWAAGVSCCFRNLKSSLITGSDFFKGLNSNFSLVFQVSFGLLEESSQFFPP